MALRIGSLSDESRPISNGYAKEARRLLRGGFREEAGKLALAGSVDRLKYGSIQSSEDKAEADKVGKEGARLERQRRLREAMKTENKDEQEVATDSAPPSNSNASATGRSTPFAETPKPAEEVEVQRGNFAGKMIDNLAGVAEAGRSASEKSRREVLRAEYEKVVNPTGKEKAGTLAEAKKSAFVGPPEPVFKPVTGEGGLEDTLASIADARSGIKESLDSTADTLKKYAAAATPEAIAAKASDASLSKSATDGERSRLLKESGEVVKPTAAPKIRSVATTPNIGSDGVISLEAPFTDAFAKYREEEKKGYKTPLRSATLAIGTGAGRLLRDIGKSYR